MCNYLEIGNSQTLASIFIVKFSDNVEFKFTGTQIKLIPYFKILLESNFNADLKISHSSSGFEFLHTFATLDEIDTADPHDKYLIVLKQCDFFCYDKLKDLIILKNKHTEMHTLFDGIVQDFRILQFKDKDKKDKWDEVCDKWNTFQAVPLPKNKEEYDPRIAYVYYDNGRRQEGFMTGPPFNECYYKEQCAKHSKYGQEYHKVREEYDTLLNKISKLQKKYDSDEQKYKELCIECKELLKAYYRSYTVKPVNKRF